MITNLRTLKNSDIAGKTILYRSPYDIESELQDNEYVVKDDSRIRATLPTLEFLIEQNCKIVILTWVGRPENGYDESLSTKPIAQNLSQLINKPVKQAKDCVGKEVLNEIEKLSGGELLMLENTRFHKEDLEENDEFAKQLTQGCDFIVFDGFPQAHRAVSSTTGILKHLPSCAGLYFDQEHKNLSGLIDNPKKPFTLIIGGAKITDKTESLYNLEPMVDKILVGGGPANIFLKKKGYNIQNSLSEDVSIEINSKFEIPVDVVAANDIDNPTEIKTLNIENELLPEGWKILDIGPKTIQNYSKIIESSQTVFWSGPMGLFEKSSFEKGTAGILESIRQIKSTALTIAGGGDTIAAIDELGSTNDLNHISLAGGASLEFLAGKKLPVVEMLKEN